MYPVRTLLVTSALALCAAVWVRPAVAQDQTGFPLTTRTPDSEPARELQVLSPTLAAEQIDRAVLNRLMQEIIDSPELTSQRLGVGSSQLRDIFTILSNAHSFINDNDLANVRAMCTAWDRSTLDGEARIEEALAAYTKRAQFTRDFIARYYRIVLADIEAQLTSPELVTFTRYMEDRRWRMASAGAVQTGAVVQNIRSGAETLQFHCRTGQL